MDYSILNDEEHERLMKNNTIVDGRSLDYCYSLLLEQDDLESKRVANILANIFDENVQRMVMRRGIELRSEPISQFLAQQPVPGSFEGRMEKKMRELEEIINKMSMSKPKRLVRQLTNSKLA